MANFSVSQAALFLHQQQQQRVESSNVAIAAN